MTKEEAFDERIAPLVSQIHDICVQHGIGFLATFCLDAEKEYHATTCLVGGAFESSDALTNLIRAMGV